MRTRMRGRLVWLTVAAGAAWPGAAAGQQDLEAILSARRDAVPDDRRSFEETWLLPTEGTSAADAAAVTRFAGRATVYQDDRKERIEIRPVSGGALGEPIVVVSDGDRYHLVTRVGATSLAGSAVAGDPLLRLVLAGPPGQGPPHRTVPAAAGGVAAVVLRHARQGEFDSDDAFALRLPQVGGGLLKEGLSSFSPGANPSVTASAGARGVGQVRTANGTISVTPDPEAVRWMETVRVSPIALEAFKLEGRLTPYNALPAAGADGGIAPEGTR